ncbi:MAG: carboxypeptidase regulatory-like domain-containing protein, partial [Planctomycetota bacterium]
KFQLEGLAGRGTYLVARGQHHLTRGRQEVRPLDLDSEEGIILHTVPGAALEGTVVDEYGAPVANAEVFVGPSLMYIIQAIRSRDIYLERVFTDGAGRFEIDAVPANMKLSVIGLDGATHPGMRDFGPLNPATDAKVKLQLVETGDLSGRIVDSEGEGVGGAKVLAIPIDLRMLVGVVRALPEYIVESGANGEFEFPELPKRNMVLIAQGREGRAAPVTCAVTGPDSEVGKDLVLQTILDVEGRVVDLNGKPIAGAKVMLNSIPTPGDRSQRSRGMPSADFLLMEAAGEILPEFLPVETWARTDANGTFNLPAWEGAKIKVEADGFSKAIYQLPEETEEERLALIMMQPGSVAGTVTGKADDKPLQFYVVNAEQRSNMLEPEVEVERFEDEDWRSFSNRQEQAEAEARKLVMGDILAEGEVAVLPAESMMANLRNVQFQEDGSGTFRIDNLMPGTYKVEARADGFVVRSRKDVVVKPGAVTEDIDLKMSRGATLKGRVVAFGSREPVAGAVVTIGNSKESGFEAYFRMGLETTAMARSGPDGSFSLEGIEEGMEWVHVLAEGFSPTSIRGRPLELEEVREDVVIQVRQGCNINGHVYDRNGVPIPARLVGGFSTDSQDFWQAATDDKGYYHIENVKPGSYFLITASLDNEALFTGNFMSVLNGSRIVQAYAKEGQTITVDIEDLSAGGCNLKGRLLSNGLALTNAT